MGLFTKEIKTMEDLFLHGLQDAFAFLGMLQFATLEHDVNEDFVMMLEEFAREHIYLEMQHIGVVDKMLRKPGDIESFEKP